MSWGGRRSKFDTFEEREDVAIMDGIEDYKELVDAEYVECCDRVIDAVLYRVVKELTK